MIKMPKGKKCSVCNEGRMRRNYIRSYHQGYKFTEINPAGVEITKGSFNPIGWLCDKCGHFIPDKDNYFMYLKWNRAKENNEERLNTLMEENIDLKNELAEYQKEYIYTERDFEIERKFMLQRFWNIRSELEHYGWLKGLRAGNKQSDEYHEERIKKLALTDDQILNKAKLIETKRKLGYT